MLSLKDQARFNAIRCAWRDKPGEFGGPEYYAAKTCPLNMKHGQAANAFPRIILTTDELANPDTEPVGLFHRYTITINNPDAFGFSHYSRNMTVREYVAAFRSKLYVGLGIPDIAIQMAHIESGYMINGKISLVILGEIA